MTKKAERLSSINNLLIFCGIQPVFDRLRNGIKFSKVGLVLIIIHSGLILHCDKKLLEEQAIVGQYLDRILFAMTYLQRIFCGTYSIFNVICAIIQFDSVTTFLDLQDEMDVYLKGLSIDMPSMYRKIKWMEIIAIIVAVVGSLIACVSSVMSYCDTFKQGLDQVQLYTYYSGVFYTLYFAAATFKVCVHVYAMSLRFQHFNELVENILNLDRKMNLKMLRE